MDTDAVVLVVKVAGSVGGMRAAVVVGVATGLWVAVSLGGTQPADMVGVLERVAVDVAASCCWGGGCT